MNQVRRGLAAAVLVVALSSPIAQASFPHEGGQPTAADPTAAAGAALAGRSVPPPIARMDGQVPTLVRPIVLDAGGGFDWADAGVGFGSAAGLALIGAGSLVALRRHRRVGPAAH